MSSLMCSGSGASGVVTISFILFCRRDDYTLSHPPTMSLPAPAEQLRYFRKRQSQIVDSIRQLVEIESPSDVKQSVDRLNAVLACRLWDLGGEVRVHAAKNFANHLQVKLKGGRADKR